MKIDKPNHKRGRDKGHITRAKRMWQSNRRPSRRESRLYIYRESIYNLLKIDKPNHRRGRDKGHITRAKRMWQSNWRQSRRERKESTQRSAQKERLGERPAEDPEEPTQKQC